MVISESTVSSFLALSSNDQWDLMEGMAAADRNALVNALIGHGVPGTVYLIHFDQPVAHAKHYLGWTLDLNGRLHSHRTGTGSKLMAELRRRGIGWRVARTWEGKDRWFERSLKNRKNAPALCPCCNKRVEIQ